MDSAARTQARSAVCQRSQSNKDHRRSHAPESDASMVGENLTKLPSDLRLHPVLALRRYQCLSRHSQSGRHFVELFLGRLQLCSPAMAGPLRLLRVAPRHHDDSSPGHDDSAVLIFPKTGLVQYAQAALGDEFLRERLRRFLAPTISQG